MTSSTKVLPVRRETRVKIFREYRQMTRIPGKPPDQWNSVVEGQPLGDQINEWLIRRQGILLDQKTMATLEPSRTGDPTKRIVCLTCVLTFVPFRTD